MFILVHIFQELPPARENCAYKIYVLQSAQAYMVDSTGGLCVGTHKAARPLVLSPNLSSMALWVEAEEKELQHNGRNVRRTNGPCQTIRALLLPTKVGMMAPPLRPTLGRYTRPQTGMRTLASPGCLSPSPMSYRNYLRSPRYTSYTPAPPHTPRPGTRTPRSPLASTRSSCCHHDCSYTRYRNGYGQPGGIGARGGRSMAARRGKCTRVSPPDGTLRRSPALQRRWYRNGL